MTMVRLILRGLAHHRRMHLAVAAGVAVAAAAIVGALVVGDSVRGTLEELGQRRLFGVGYAMESPGRFVRAELAGELSAAMSGPRAHAAIALPGSAIGEDGAANHVQIYGVDDEFLARLGGPEAKFTAGDCVVINGALARKLSARAGQEIQLLLTGTAGVAGESPVPGQAAGTIRPRLAVAAVLPEADLSLRVGQGTVLNAFVPLGWLGGRIGQPGGANLILVDEGASSPESFLRKCVQLADLGLSVRAVPGTAMAEVRTDAVFLPGAVEEALAGGLSNTHGVMAYMVNHIAADGRSCPYSVVAGLEGGQGPVPADLKEDEIVVNEWLAGDLGLKAGQQVTLEYFVPGEGGALATASRTFRVRAGWTAVEAPGADRSLMPDYPGLKDIQDCRNWRPGVSLTETIRPQDEKYWREHKGAPKAYVTLAAARGMWANRFGTLTAVRLDGADAQRRVAEALRAKLAPESVGLSFRPVAAQASRAAREGTDFSQLFLALSFFLIGAAVGLLGLLFSLGVSQRAAEGGTLLAMGFAPRQVRRVFMAEGGVAAAVGSLAGAAMGLGYTKLLLGGLATLWAGATAGARIEFHAEPQSVAMGVVGAMVTAMAAMRLSLHWRLRLPVRQLLAGADTVEALGPRGGAGRKVAFRMTVLAALAWGLYAATAGRAMGAETSFFIGGAILLCLGVLGAGAIIDARAGRDVGASLAGLARRNAARRMKRSLTVVGSLACGCFVVVAVGASRLSPPSGPPDRRGGQGGFALYAETAVPVVRIPPVPAGLDVKLVPLRVKPGDAADCFNLARAQQPRVLGVDPRSMAGRFRFLREARPGAGWEALDAPAGEDVLPAIGDEPTVRWALGLTGEKTLAMTDEAGRTRRVKIVGVLAGSVLQGSLLVSERRFTQAWPSLAGYSAFLAESPDAKAAAGWLRGRLRDFGVDVEPTADRLGAFQTVENTYLSIFGVLGAMGLLLGSAALAVLVVSNVQARRGELAILRAVGFERAAVRRLVLREHLMLVALGLAAGLAAGALAVAPAAVTMERPVAVAPLAVLLACVGAAAVAWVRLATGWALRGDVLGALRNE